MSEPLGLRTAGPEVVLAGVNESFLNFIAHLGLIHQLLFGVPLVLTSAMDGVHAPSSLHAVGRAVDIRTEDKDPQTNMLFLMVLAYAAEDVGITVFDERNLADAPHLHVEWHGA